MALVKCKECGEDVSTKAKACPKCGAKAPKKTSLFTWFVLIFILFTVYISNKNSDSTGSSGTVSASTDNSGSDRLKPKEKVAPPSPAWVTSTSKDEMTGQLSAYAHSPTAYPSKKMSFPYHNVKSWIGVGCDKDNEWVYFGFNDSPNLTKDETKSGYNLIKTRIKWDGNVESTSLTQDWGARFIHFRDYKSAISKIASSKSTLLELQWHGQQPTYFTYSLDGSSKAIAEIREKCSAQG